MYNHLITYQLNFLFNEIITHKNEFLNHYQGLQTYTKLKFYLKRPFSQLIRILTNKMTSLIASVKISLIYNSINIWF